MRIEQLTFTRFLAAISIVIYHYGKNCSVFYNDFTGFLFKQADVGVSYFFILSGFVMIIAYNNKAVINSFEYLKHRLARIYPLYLLGIFFVFIFDVLEDKTNFSELLLNIFMLQAWIPDKALTLNNPGWSISVEFLFYLMFPFLFNFIYKKANFKTIAISILILWLISQITLHILIPINPIAGFPLSSKDLLYFPLMHLNEFLMGNLAGLYLLHKTSIKRNFDLQIVLILVVFVLVLKFPIDLIYHNGMFAVLFVPLIILLSLNNGLVTIILRHKACVFLGEISFGVYILQFPVWLWITDYRLQKYLQIDKVDDFYFAFFIRLFALLLISAISYRCIETPIRDRIKNFRSTRFRILGFKI